MIIKFHPKFNKTLAKRITNNSKLFNQYIKRLKLFEKNQKHPLLKDHCLTGSKKEYRSFSINGDCRVVYFQKTKNEIILIDIGSHNQVY